MEHKEGFIYKIVYINNPKIFYIGSTTRNVKTRFTEHKYDYKRGKKCSLFELFDLYSVKNFKIELIKKYNICDKKHLLAYEQLYINKFKNSSNKNNAMIFSKNITQYDYNKKKYEKVKDTIEYKNYQKEYRKKYIIPEKQKELHKNKWSEIIECECGKKIRKDSLTKHRKSQDHIKFYQTKI